MPANYERGSMKPKTQMNRLGEESCAAGRALGLAVMSGQVGATQRHAPGGAFYLERAAKVAEVAGCSAGEIVRLVTEFHAERVDAVPSLTVYPELRGARDVLLARYRGMAEAGMSSELVALAESLDFWRSFRFAREFGKPFVAPARPRTSVERCRVVYLPDSDHGPLHMKNVDDPMESWVPDPPLTNPGPWPHAPLFFDGVGNGLHLDEAPPEIFPANGIHLCQQCCETVAEAEEFLARYNYFWGGGNLLVHDDQGHSVAFDKASRCRFVVRKPGPSGLNYVNGMSSFDPDYEAFINRQRAAYLAAAGLDESGTDEAYWRFCRGVLRNMARYMDILGRAPTRDKLIEVMTARDADGPLCKSGVFTHPDETAREATLWQNLFFLADRILWRRQWRGNTPVWEDPWEIIRYSGKEPPEAILMGPGSAT